MTPLELRVARLIHERERRERLALLARAVVEGVVLVVALLGLCGLLIALFILLAPSGAALPGVTG